VRTDRFLYIRNFHPRRPLLQPNAYKDAKPTVRRLRELQASGDLPEISERLLFAPERPEEELYDWRGDPWQVRNLAADPAQRDTLEALRARLADWMAETGDDAAESRAMYESDMRVYVGRGNPVVEENIAIMKRWEAEGR